MIILSIKMRESLCYSCIHLVKDKNLDGFRTCDVKNETKTPVTNIDSSCKFYSPKKNRLIK